jgi:hypothetical protein
MKTACFWIPAVVLCVAAGCRSDGMSMTAPSDPPPDIIDYVTGEARESLSGQGLFELAPPSSEHRETIPAERARQLAAAFVLTYGRQYRVIWERDLGESINLITLEPDTRVFFADTPYGRFPSGFHPAFARAYGPWYLVWMKSAGKPVLIVAVSAYNTDIGVDKHGYIVQPRMSGNDFEVWAISRQPGGIQPLTPETAVEFLGRGASVRVARTPRLLLRNVDQHPAAAVWKLALERPIKVRDRTSGERHDVAEVFVGPHQRLWTATPGQPRVHHATAIRVNAQGQNVGREAIQVPIRADFPTELHEVILEHEGA